MLILSLLMHGTKLQALHAVEGDLRLVEETSFNNWWTGRLQVFFEGSWSQVCGSLFGAPDANVACRQLGYSAGTVLPQSSGAERTTPETPIFPEVAILGAGCTGEEDRLVDCGPGDPTDALTDYDGSVIRGCQAHASRGLFIGCVATADNGITPCRMDCVKLVMRRSLHSTRRTQPS